MTKKSQRHPLEKSLAIFPLVPRNQANLVSNSFNNQTTNPQPKRKSCPYQRIEIHFDDSPRSKRKQNSSSWSGKQKSKEEDQENNSEFLATNRKLNQAARYLPKQRGGSLSLKLPPILSCHPNNSQERKKPSLNNIVLSNEKPRWKPCTCKNKNKSPKEELTNIKLKKIAQTFRPEETPYLFSVYVRWKTNRNGSVEYDYRTLVSTFASFGDIVDIVFKSRTSAVVVFTTVEAAATAAKVFAKIGSEMKLFVRWLNDM